MLSTLKKNITLKAICTIDGQDVAGYSATINSENPEDINFSDWPISKALYKANRVQCRKDQAEFEDAAYVLQDQMISEASDTTDKGGSDNVK